MVTLDDLLLVFVGGPLLFLAGLFVAVLVRNSVRPGRFGGIGFSFEGELTRAQHPIIFWTMIVLTAGAVAMCLVLPVAGLGRVLYLLLTV